MIWPPESLEVLRLMHADGKSAGQIAHALGFRTRNPVCGMIDRMQKRGELKRRPAGRTHAPKTPPRPRSAPRKRYALPASALPPGTVAASPAASPAPAPASLNVRVLDLTPETCRWPTSGVGEHMLSCGHPVAEKQIYCTAHCRVAFNDWRGG